MIKKISSRLRVDGIFFFFSFVEEMKNTLLSKIVSLTIKKRTKLMFPCKIRGFSYIKLGNNFSSGSGLWLDAIDNYFDQTFTPKIEIGDDVSVSNNVHIACINQIIINSGVLIGSNVLISDHQHGDTNFSERDIMPKFRRLRSSGIINIGKNAWIGDNSYISGNVSIGENAIIGANSVVTSDIPSYSVAVGTPAKVIRRHINDENQPRKTT